MSVRLEISSEIYSETDFCSLNTANGTTVSRFSFTYPASDEIIDPSPTNKEKCAKVDSDGDLIVQRKKRGSIEIEHLKSTDLRLVGLQVWRGALILADFLFHYREKFADKNVLEVGSGVGLSSIAAAIFSQKHIVCTDIDIGGILNIIRTNVKRNASLMGGPKVDVMELNFKDTDWSNELRDAVRRTSLVLAADVIYDDDLTDAFLQTVEIILDPSDCNSDRSKEIYIAMEKRYVFTVADLETVAPCYEHFLRGVDEKIRAGNSWKLQFIPIDFPQYFDYARVKELILLKLSL